MAKLPKLTGKELAKIIEKFGFVYSHTIGSHMVYKHPDGRRTTIPCHSGEEMGARIATEDNQEGLRNQQGRIFETRIKDSLTYFR